MFQTSTIYRSFDLNYRKKTWNENLLRRQDNKIMLWNYEAPSSYAQPKKCSRHLPFIVHSTWNVEKESICCLATMDIKVTLRCYYQTLSKKLRNSYEVSSQKKGVIFNRILGAGRGFKILNFNAPVTLITYVC